MAAARDEALSEAEHQRRVMQLLSDALELEGVDRRHFLDRTCAGDPALRQELESLLDEEPALDDGFLEVPAAAGLAAVRRAAVRRTGESGTLPHGSPVPLPVERLGPYRVVRTLGRGGMGTVFLGEQQEPVRRRVALKVIDAIHGRTGRQRFAAECQALARLGHPNVASLYEVGTTEEGYPFVAMELVDGTVITTWCDERTLGLGQRLELFLGACAGVRHAHEKGVLHRDIKPSNVLVTEVDGRPAAKLIDFGIARAHGDGPSLIDTSTAITLEHQIIGSPAYMSPEALPFSDRDVDTRSDVYSLGLLLYELLAGVLPFELEDQSLADLIRRLEAADEMPAPSVRFRGLDDDDRRQIAERRGLSEKALERRIRGDLDAIAARAIARDPERRYDSAADLAADLERHLHSEPVAARPPTAGYLLGCFLRRFLRGAAVALLGRRPRNAR